MPALMPAGLSKETRCDSENIDATSLESQREHNSLSDVLTGENQMGMIPDRWYQSGVNFGGPPQNRVDFPNHCTTCETRAAILIPN